MGNTTEYAALALLTQVLISNFYLSRERHLLFVHACDSFCDVFFQVTLISLRACRVKIELPSDLYQVLDFDRVCFDPILFFICVESEE